MKIRNFPCITALAAFLAITTTPAVWAADKEVPRETVTTAFHYPIANVQGKILAAVVVDYPPGGKTPEHRHGTSFVVGYVLSGAIRSKVNDGPEQVFHAGESFTAAPGAHHKMSENASEIEPAKMIAVFVSDTTQKELVEFDKKK